MSTSVKGRKKAPAVARKATVARSDTPLVGRDELMTRLARMVAGQRAPAVIIFSGPRGIGKQRLATWLAQGLLCQMPDAERPATGHPCDDCPSCKQARGVAHPDLHWFVPHAPLGGGTSEAQASALESQRSAWLEEARRDALASVPASGVSYAIAAMQAVRRTVALTPVSGSRRVIIIGDADRLAAPDGTTGDAANVLLKTLEEPPHGTTFILTTSRLAAVPLTIRSRAVTVSIPPLELKAVASILHSGYPSFGASEIDRAARLSRGSVLRAVRLLDAKYMEEREKAQDLLLAVSTGDTQARYAAVQAQGFADARGAFSSSLLVMADVAADFMNGDSGEASDAPQPATGAQAARKWGAALRVLLDTYTQAQGNGNPQLLLHGALLRIQQVFA